MGRNGVTPDEKFIGKVISSPRQKIFTLLYLTYQQIVAQQV
jgi:hypothetical protein